MKEKFEQSPRLSNTYRDIVVISRESRLGRVIGATKKTILPVAAALSLIASACSGGEMKKQEEAFPRILPLSGEIFLTQGAHTNDDSLTGIKSSIDFAPKEVKNCPPEARVTVDQPAVATTSGTITIVGNERDRNDPNHSIVEIKEDGTGLRFGTMHLDKMPENIQVGEKIKKGDIIGKPSCEVPKGGQTTGVHIHSYVKDGNDNFVPINGQEISGWKIEGDKMTKKGEKTRIADTRRCATDTACQGIRNDLLNNPTKTSSKAVLGAATGPTRPGPISATVGEKPVVTETPKPAPSPAQESKEKEPIFPLVLLPIHISEEQTPDFKVTKKFREENPWYRSFGKKPLKPQPGWKYIYVEFAIENKGNNTKVVSLDRRSLFASKIRTKEGFEYTNPIEFGYSGIVIPDRIFSPTNTYFNQNALPPGFRIVGVYNDLLWAYPPAPEPDLKEGLINRVSFAVGEKTTDYKLSIPGFPELDLTKDAVDMRSLKLPTDRPDSDFKNPGATINIPGKGSVTFEGAVSRTPIQKPGTKVNIRFRFHNNSIGYGQNFNLTTKLFGDDGILYTTSYNADAAMKIFPNQPLSWDGYIFGPYVPPGNTETQEVGIVISSSLKSGKLVVSGDINEIFNLNLPEITNPVKR